MIPTACIVPLSVSLLPLDVVMRKCGERPETALIDETFQFRADGTLTGMFTGREPDWGVTS